MGLPCVGVGKIIDAAGEFFHHLADVHWLPLAIGLGFHLLRLLARVPAWRNILRASYPDLVIPRRTVTGAYLAGVGVNSVLPARGGDILKLYLVKHRVEGTTYPTLGSTLVVETLFDSVGRGRDPRLGPVHRRPTGAERAAAPAAGGLELAAAPQEGGGRDRHRLARGPDSR